MICHCAKGWICEKHPEQVWPHGDCPGPGEPCPNPDCPFWYGPKPAAFPRYPSREEMAVEERRKYVRRPFAIKCQWKGSIQPSPSHISEMGAGGCFVATRNVPLFGERVEITAMLPDGPLLVRGRVVYGQPLIGFAVEFYDLEAATRGRLERFLSTPAKRP